MLRAFRTIRAGERRDAWTAFAVLFGLIASHAILETARDALFLARVPAARLPWVYMAIAAVSLALTRAQTRFSARMDSRKALSAWIAAAGIVTLVFWLLLSHLGDAGLYALYVWSGVLTTLILVHFWTLLGDLFTITQAKRLYGFVGTGSVLGAISGSGLAGVLSQIIAPAELLLAAAAGLAITSVLPAILTGGGGAPEPDQERVSIAHSAAYVARKGYPLWLALVVIISAAGLTFGDYLFKSTMAAEVAPDELGTYFASVYFALNLLSLLTQLFLIGWLLRRFDVIRALALLPVFLALGAGAMLIAPGLIAALVVKGADGSLRYSVHRTATELLYVPLSEGARRKVKAFIDVACQRGGQAIASIAILAITWAIASASASTAILAALLLLSTIAWLVATGRLRGHYLDLFRHTVQRGQIEHPDAFPDLDMGSLENIVAALDSADDSEVMAALDILEREGRQNLVPALALYHPSEDVVLRALTIIARSRRQRAAHATRRLLEHPSPRVRAMAAAAFSILSDGEQRLRMRLSTEESASVRATIMVNLIASGAIVGSDAKDAIESLLAHGTTETKIAMTQAIAWRGAPGFESVLLELARATEPAVRLAATEAMARLQSADFLPATIDLLGHEQTRQAAIEALVEYGDDGLRALADALADQSLPPVVRWQLPAALSGFAPERVVPVMLAALPGEPDGMMRYRLIRALERLVHGGVSMPIDRAAHQALTQSIESTVRRAYRYLDRGRILRAGAEKDPHRATPGHELLTVILADKRAHAIDRVFRLLGLRHPRQPFARIYRGLGSDGARSSSLELLENILRPPLRGAIVGLVDDIADGERLHAAGPYHQGLRLSYQELLATMLESESDTVTGVTVFHIAELGLTELRPQIAALGDRVGDSQIRSQIAKALETLAPSAPASHRGKQTPAIAKVPHVD